MRVLKLIAVSACLLMMSSCAIYHHYGSYYGRLVEAETENPIEGAVVLALYYTEQYLSPGGPVSYFLDAQEAVTDSKGQYNIDSLNALAFRPLSIFQTQPDFIIFKPEYRCSMPRWSDGQYESIGMRKLRTREERLDSLDCTPIGIPDRKMLNFRKMQSAERVNLGLKPLEFKEK